MVRAPYFDKNGVKKGAWSKEEDEKLKAFIEKHGHPNWRKLPKLAGLSRCGKSCRLRWVNYLQPDINLGNYTDEEEALIISLHQSLGNKWSKIAEKLPGRSDNDIKNHWHTHLRKRVIEKPIVSYTGNELVLNIPKCNKEKGVPKVSDMKDRDEVEALLAVLCAESSFDAHNEQSSSSSSSSLDHAGLNGYYEEPGNDSWRMGDDIFMDNMELMNNYHDETSTYGDDMIIIGESLWPSVEFYGHDNHVMRGVQSSE